MHRVTSGWTSRHARVACAYAAGFLGCLAGLAEPGSAPFWVAAAVAVAVLVSLNFDAFAGIVVGLACAAALIAVKRATGRWNDDAFWTSAIETLALVLAGATSGWAGVALRQPFTRADASTGPASRVAPALGSLGLLPYDVALLRLEEEVERASEHRRPLAVLVMDAEIATEAPEAVERAGALRAVSRILETRLHDRDVPFAITPERLGAIMPETDAAGAWERVGGIADALAEATFMSRANGERVPVADLVRVHAGISELSSGATSAEALLGRATRGIRGRGARSEPEQR